MDGDAGRCINIIILLVILLFIRAFFTVSEYAIRQISVSRLKELSEKNKKYSEMEQMLLKPEDLITALSIEKNFVGVFVSGISIFYFSEPFSNVFLKISDALTDAIARLISSALIGLISVFIITVFTDIVAKRISFDLNEDAAIKCGGGVIFLKKLLTPFVRITTDVSKLICLLFKIPYENKKGNITEEKILKLVDEGNETGVIEESQRDMINNIFEFGDSIVGDVMTHRTDLIAVEAESKIGDVVYLAINEGFSRIPVYEDTVDKIIGIIYVKDLLCLVGCEHSEDFAIRQFMRKAMYIPETSKCSDVFENMGKKKAQMAIVVDEYGGTAGMVTMEDLLEEIVGNIQDEYDDEEADVSEISEGIYTIDGSADPEDILPELGADLPDGNNYDTMSAFFVDFLGRIPESDETPSIIYQNIEFTALVTEDNWVTKLKAKKLPEV